MADQSASTRFESHGQGASPPFQSVKLLQQSYWERSARSLHLLPRVQHRPSESGRAGATTVPRSLLLVCGFCSRDLEKHMQCLVPKSRLPYDTNSLLGKLTGLWRLGSKRDQAGPPNLEALACSARLLRSAARSQAAPAASLPRHRRRHVWPYRRCGFALHRSATQLLPTFCRRFFSPCSHKFLRSATSLSQHV